jgi:hypothetical protein
VARFVPVRRSTALVVAAVTVVGVGASAGWAASHAKPAKAAIYLVGGDVESINPTADMLKDQDFYLGGYGFASGHPGNVTALPSATGGRFATGILGDKSFNRFPSTDGTYESDGSHSRAFAVSDKKATIVLAQIETQGFFNAYKQGPFGENEIRKDAAAQISSLVGPKTAPAPTASQIVVDSDHSHGGPDTAGVWGGVPTSYLKEVHDQTVKAVVDAWQAMKPATLTYGIAHAGVSGNNGLYPPQECIDAGKPDCMNVGNADWLLHNQFSTDPANYDMDDEIRVFQARDAKDHDKVLDTYVNYASHPTVLGSDNTLVTGDYVGRLNVEIEKAFGGFAMDQVGTLGREQPERASCSDPSKTDQAAKDLCALDNYAKRVVTKIKAALSPEHSQPVTGAPIVAMNSYLLSDPTTNAVLLAGEYAGQAIGAPFGRANNAPWYTGTILGTTVYTGRIGPVLVTGGPGEMYAQIWQKVKDTVACSADKCADTAKDSGITSVMNIGTAGDFLGYIIAPLEAYPQPMESSVISTGNSDCSGVPEPAGVCPDPIGNDNYFFNVSHTFGERLTCDFLRGADDVLQKGTTYWDSYVRCPAFINDHVAPEGLDTQFPSQPDLSSALTHM